MSTYHWTYLSHDLETVLSQSALSGQLVCIAIVYVVKLNRTTVVLLAMRRMTHHKCKYQPE